MQRLIVIGNGVAGVTTARFVAERDPSIDVTIYSQEAYPYYPRPRLIDLLAGRVSADAMALYPPDWYETRRLRTLMKRRVVQVDREAQRVLLDDGSSDSYDRLLLATGAHGWVPPIKGADTAGVFTLRTMDDALSILDCLGETQRIVMLGGGRLGLDTGAALRARDESVCVVEMLPWLLPRQLDAAGAAVLTRTLEESGMEIVTGDICTWIEGPDRVRRVHLKSGRVIDADMIIVSAGVRCNIELARGAGLDCGRGILVNERMQTSDPNIYAVGDVAEFGEVLWCIIPAALTQARVAAEQIVASMTNSVSDRVYQDIVPSTTLKVTGIDLASIGEVNPEGEGFVEVRYSEPDCCVYKKLVIREGRIVGAILLGDREDVRVVNQLMARGVDISGREDELLSAGFDLMGLVRATA